MSEDRSECWVCDSFRDCLKSNKFGSDECHYLCDIDLAIDQASPGTEIIDGKPTKKEDVKP